MNRQGVAQLDIRDQKDVRMRFRNLRDPLYIAFDYLESRPVSALAKDFLKDTMSDFINFISFNQDTKF